MQSFKHSIAVIILGVFVPIFVNAGGVISVPTESALNSALSGGGTVTFASDMTITVTSVKELFQNTTIDGTGHNITISGGNSTPVIVNDFGSTLTLNNI